MRKFKENLIWIIIMIVCISILSCKTVSKEEAEAAFLKRNPDFTILSANVGEGDSGNVYYHFEFKKPNDDKIQKEIWLFVKQEDGTWKTNHK